ncbi:hypothetical protein DEJ23_06360 [Curtobacterium sp. MCSS17_008]|uniref:polysaccharide pyruvyl transferase family protein n=1 Tax=Curtobacterium sp. MCSS17_008 TaxID=2175647 RepID=UPI000DA77B4E|nr:polysaccharide pyruvyl transferase family protein [Curtobacterium sp. MCSS17_008]PZF57760.1 hypothetical protein DEJ23_06360 [Curtobacterium sp. MCSS17_008]
MRLAHFGTFDISNYGDLLFPLIAEHHLGDLFDHIVHISPIGGKVYGDVPASIAVEDALTQEYDAVMIGGGNLINPRPTTLPAYTGKARVAYPQLWASAARLAAEQAIPLALNAPGIPRKFGWATRGFLRGLADTASYFSVRDEYSADIARRAGATDVHVAPDSALAIPRVLGDIVERPSGRIVVHLNERYIGLEENGIAALLDDIARTSGDRICLLAIGPCHGDDIVAENIAGLMRTDPIVLSTPHAAAEVAGEISAASGYIGSSMHGYVTAVAYGVPALLVADGKAQHKFAGLLSHVGGERDLRTSWADAREEVTDGNWPGSADTRDLKLAETRLTAHWNQVRAALTSQATVPRRLVQREAAPSMVALGNAVDSGIKPMAHRLLRRFA